MHFMQSPSTRWAFTAAISRYIFYFHCRVIVVICLIGCSYLCSYFVFVHVNRGCSADSYNKTDFISEYHCNSTGHCDCTAGRTERSCSAASGLSTQVHCTVEAAISGIVAGCWPWPWPWLCSCVGGGRWAAIRL